VQHIIENSVAPTLKNPAKSHTQLIDCYHKMSDKPRKLPQLVGQLGGGLAVVHHQRFQVDKA
jgi:hypothetical protein